jgi:hypothetical protein
MTQVTDTDIRDLRDLINKLDNKLDNIEIRLTGKIDILSEKLQGEIKELKVEVKAFDAKFDERTKLGFWGFILRGVVLTLIIGAGGYMLPIIAEYVHKLPTL